MSTELEKITSELMLLPVESRAWLARTLIESLDEYEDSNGENIGEDELNHRYEEIRSGQVVCKSLEEVIKQAKERIKCPQ